MDPSVKLAFDEILRRFDAFDAEWESKSSDVESRHLE